MVKFVHCETCKKVYNTETFIGEVHMYSGTCPSCKEQEQQNADNKEFTLNEINNSQVESIKDVQEIQQTSPIELDKELLLNLKQKANDIVSGLGSVEVLIKEIKDDLVRRAKEKIEETFQSFDVGKIDAQKVVKSAESILDYLSEYQDYMNKVVKKIQEKPKMKLKTAIEKVLKESTSEISKEIAKDAFLNRKSMLKKVYGKAIKWYDIYSGTEDVLTLAQKMILHPFNEIHKKLSTLPFYNSN
ncbi:MAG: hypothetical protein ACFFA3_13485 [Promethearchaeota archaeon]